MASKGASAAGVTSQTASTSRVMFGNDVARPSLKSNDTDIPANLSNASWTVSHRLSKSSKSNLRGDTMEYEVIQAESSLRFRIATVMDSGAMDGMMGLIILFNIALLILETDDFAVCVKDNLPAANCSRQWVDIVNYSLLVLYTSEFMLRLFAHRRKFFLHTANVVDFLNVCLGWLDVLATSLPSHAIPNTQMLRVIRLVRLVRAARLLATNKELNSMLRGFASAMRAMFWGFVLIGLTCALLAIMSVELIYPIVNEIDTPDMCMEGFSSVFGATILLFQGMVAGDSWGACAIPIIKAQPWTTLFFGGAFMLIELGFTNLVLSVIVERSGMATHERIIEQRREQLQLRQMMSEKLKEILQAVDTDGSGMISEQELMEGMATNKELQVVMDCMHIDEKSLPKLLTLMDTDKSGEVSYQEFIDIISMAESPSSNVHQFLTNYHLLEVSKSIQELIVQQGVALKRMSGECSEQRAVAHQAAPIMKPGCTIKYPGWEKTLEQQSGHMTHQKVDVSNSFSHAGSTPLMAAESPAVALQSSGEPNSVLSSKELTMLRLSLEQRLSELEFNLMSMLANQVAAGQDALAEGEFAKVAASARISASPEATARSTEHLPPIVHELLAEGPPLKQVNEHSSRNRPYCLPTCEGVHSGFLDRVVKPGTH